MNHEISSGDILPAKEAVESIDLTDLSSPIEIPPIPEDAHPENISDEERGFLKSEINRLKEERNALILAHNYMPKDVQDVADVVGDSLYLAQRGKDSDADILCEASVLFMQEILAVMKKTHQKILAPDLKALCSLAAHVDVGKIKAWKEKYPKGIVASYVNTYLKVKAISDYCYTSSNYVGVIKFILENHPGEDLLVLPDVHLGFSIAKFFQKIGQSLDRLWLMMGACHVHDIIRPSHIEEQRKLHPDAAVVFHGECACVRRCMVMVGEGSVPEDMMQSRSTQGMIKFVKESPAKKIIFATEVGNLYPMSKAAPDKILIPANPEAICAFMKQNTLRKVYISLRDLVREIVVDPELADKARRPIERMLSIT